MVIPGRRSAVTAAVGLFLLPTAAAVPSVQAQSNDKAGVQAIRNVTSQYRSAAQAVADGFQPTDHCIASPAGGMGYHYINPHRVDGVLNWKEPEVLLYRDGPGGSRVLTGVEYLVVDADQNLSTVERHQVFGHVLRGPMEGHEDGMPRHYDRHAWVWEVNPSGTWEDWNRNISCGPA